MPKYPRRAKSKIKYHGREGRPVIHKSGTGKRYIMVRKRGGGTKRLYEGSAYRQNGRVRRLTLK